MNDYEVLVAVSEKVSEEDQKKLVKQLEEQVEKAKGQVASVDDWGKRALAFPINKNSNAFYFLVNFSGNTQVPVDLNKQLRLEDKILRFIINKKEVTRKPKKVAVKKKVAIPEIIR